jgi:hypothetical protein
MLERELPVRGMLRARSECCRDILLGRDDAQSGTVLHATDSSAYAAHLHHAIGF